MTLLWLSGAFVTGVWLGVEPAAGWQPPGAALLLWAMAVVFAILRERVSARRVLPAVIGLALLLGLARVAVDGGGGAPDATPPGLSAGAVALQGRLEGEPRPYGGVTRLPLSVVQVMAVGRTVDFDRPVRVDVIADRLFGAPDGTRGFRYGDSYTVTGRLQLRSPESALPPGISPEAAGVVTGATVRLAGAEAGNRVRREIADARGAATSSLFNTVPGAAAGLSAAVTTGDRTGLTPGTRDDFRSAGLSHLLAISGLHVAIVAGLALAAAATIIGRRRQLYLIVPVLAVAVYAVIAGLTPSVTRAAVMAGVYMLAIALGRQRSVLPAIAFAGAAMALLDPRAVGTLSFQLSFAAVLGIAVLEPELRPRMDRLVERVAPEAHPVRLPVSGISRGLGYSLAATVGTLPLVGSTFDEVPLLGAIATVAALPAVPLLIVASAAVALIDPLFSPLAAPFGWTAWLAAEWLILVARAFAAIPGGTLSATGWNGWFIAGWYGALFAWLGRRSLRRMAAGSRTAVRELGDSARLPGRRAFSWLAAPAIAVAVLPWIAVAQLPGDRLAVTFFETDRGDLILVETPGGNRALIDGGRDPGGAIGALGDALPFWDRDLDVVVLTHSDADHVGGLVDLIARYDVGVVIDTNSSADTAVFREWRDRLAERDGPVLEPLPGMIVDLGSGVTLEVLWAGSPELPSTNAASTVMLLRHGGVRMLLTGDIPRAVEARLADGGTPIAAEVLKAPHHGSDTSSSAVFLDAVAPSLVVIPTGNRNPFGHPAAAVLARYAERVPDAPVFVTRDRGDVTVTTDGRRLWVSASR